ncbi:SET and MYND protein [Plasmodium inui San Antonio 1]|uniref:SET and MYND protein n=1 Tax=Plasmodium inui San Antonio 1 TaxID=1237626 RepID=W7A690_9APIC|nr:SET and MYND protein [Plasmodium inui San Antonio 1]EUD68642.1 SET and MYND protein [Plasmodium inui San Antonio 1]
MPASPSQMYKVDYKEDKGKYVVAVSQMRAGYCIVETHPEIFVPLSVKYMAPRIIDAENKKSSYKTVNICFYCFEKFSKSFYCPNCKYVVYCSEVCLELAWKLHRDECEVFKSNIFDKFCPSIIMRMVINSYLSHFNFYEYCGSVAELSKEKYEYFKYPAYIVAVALMSKKKKMFANFEDNESILKNVIEKFVKISKNSLQIIDNELEPAGLGFYKKPVAYFNHSCLSNCVTIFKNQKLFIRTLMDVYPGEELTISYIDIAFDKNTRLAICMDQYFFTCTCKLCKVNVVAECQNIFNTELICTHSESCKKSVNHMELILISELERKNSYMNKSQFKNSYPVLKKTNEQQHVWKCSICKNEVHDNIIKSLMEKEKETVKETAHLESLFSEKYTYDNKSVLQSLNKIKSKIDYLTTFYHHTRYSLQKMRAKILYISIQLQEFKLAYNIANQYLKSIEVSYGKYSPIYGYYIFLTGKLALFLDLKSEGLSLIHKAKKNIIKTYGPDSPIYKDLEKFLYTNKY